MYGYMKLVQIFRCFCDETRLRILHLLTKRPLCVCHFQEILKLPQVTISKHLAYLRANSLVHTQRHQNWMIYRLSETPPPELDLQLRCLQDCVQSNPIFRADLKRLRALKCECTWVDRAVQTHRKQAREVSTKS